MMRAYQVSCDWSRAGHVTTSLPLIGQGERNLAFWTRASRGELSDEDWREFIK